jgi:hypothetical protein
MDDRIARVESAVAELEQSIARVSERVAVIERAITSAPRTDAEPFIDAPPSALPSLARDDVVSLVSFAGRTFVVLGGAYLLRALTDAAVIPVAPGMALGLIYALGWLVMSDHAGRTDRRSSAAFHGLAAAMIAFPLVWESVVRFRLLTPAGATIGLALVTTLTLITALRQHSQLLGWIAVTAALATALGAVAATGVVLPFAAFTIGLGVATLWIGYGADWVWLRWPVALVADLMVLALAVRASGGSWPDPPAGVILLQLLLLTGHLASVAVRTLLRGRDVNVFEIVQTAAALAVGFGGAMYVARATGFGAVPIAAMTLLVGGGCYGVAFAFLSRKVDLRRNFYFYTSLGLMLVLVSTALLFSASAVTLGWTAAGVLASWLALRTDRITLNSHAAVYVLAAASASGLLAAATAALAGPATSVWAAMPVIALTVLLGTAACWTMPMARAAEASSIVRLPRLAMTIVLAWSAAGWLVAVIAPLLPHGADLAVDAGALATVRTCVLAGAAIALAWAGRSARFREARWLLYPVLAAGGLKLLIEDLPRSRPATLFIALAVYGGALIVGPRLGRARRVGAPSHAPRA